jgi:hypothetical protein
MRPAGQRCRGTLARRALRWGGSDVRRVNLSGSSAANS